MSKTAEKRRKARIRYLIGLAQSDPKAFHKALSKRLSSWSRELKARNESGRISHKKRDCSANTLIDCVREDFNLLRQELSKKGLDYMVPDDAEGFREMLEEYRTNRGLRASGPVSENSLNFITIGRR